MVSRRKLLKAGSAGLLASLISPWSFAQTAPALLQGTRQRQFTRLMPNPLDPANLFAPDSFLGTDDVRDIIDRPKWFRRSGVLVGYAGWVGQILWRL